MSINIIVMPEPFWQHVTTCCMCNVEVYNCKLGIPLYEGIPVPGDWEGDWGGFDACRDCFTKYELGLLETWTTEDLERSQNFNLADKEDAN